MKGRRALGELVYYGLIVLVLGTLVHFVVILAIPLVASRDAYARLDNLVLDSGKTVGVPQSSPILRLLPFFDPAVAVAICRYDLRDGPVRVVAPLRRGAFTSISLHSRRGSEFYALTDRAASKGAIEAVIVTPGQMRGLQSAEDEDNPSSDLRIVSPTIDGFVIHRVFSELPTLYQDAFAEASTLVCSTEHVVADQPGP